MSECEARKKWTQLLVRETLAEARLGTLRRPNGKGKPARLKDPTKGPTFCSPDESGELKRRYLPPLSDLLRMYGAGMAVGVANAAVFHPVDALRIRFFFRKKSLGSSVSFLNGITFNIVSTGVKQMAVFPTQELMKKYFRYKGMDEYKSQLYSGIGSGLVLGIIAAPINTIKVPQQASRSPFKVLNVIKHVYTERGMAGFWRGGLGIIIRDTVWATAYFPAYGLFMGNKSNKKDRLSMAIIYAGTIAAVVSYPFDGARLYRQHHKEQHSFFHGIRQSFSTSPSNLKSFATGIIRVPLATAFCHSLYILLTRNVNSTPKEA